MANRYKKCLCGVRHNPINCQWINDSLEYVEPKSDKRKYEQKVHPLSQNPEIVPTFDFYVAWLFISFLLGTIMVVFML